MKNLKLLHFFTIATFLLLASCSALKTAPYDQYSYQKAVEIKVDASQLIDKASTAYQDHIKEINHLENEITKIVEYEKYKPNNEITYEMWLLLSNKEKNLLSGFLNRWKEKGKLSPYFVEEAKQQIVEAMNLLIQYEGKKELEVKNQLIDLISKN